MRMILGVTGGSGCGKSTFSKMLTEFGAQMIDADVIAREIVKPEKPALNEIAEIFGRQFLKGNGELDRKKLGELVFSDPHKLHILNQITHKYIIEEIRRQLATMCGSVIIVDAAVLYESGLSQLCSRTVCVLASEEVRAERIMARDGLMRERALERIHSQQSDEFYKTHADDVIYNNGDTEELFACVKKYWEQLVKMCE